MQYSWLEKKIKAWMRQMGKPNPSLNGWAPCPFVLTYMDQTKIVIVEKGIKDPIETNMDLLVPLKLKAIVLAFPRKPNHSQIEKTCEKLLDTRHDIECLIVNHKLKGTYRGVFTGFETCDLVILQDANHLKWARTNLKQRGYYATR